MSVDNPPNDTPEDLRFPSHGTACAAYVYRPAADGTGGPVPCVVMAHGFSGTRDDRLPAFARRFAAAGTAVVVFDYRHFGASDGEPRQLIDIRRQLQDWRAAVAFARGLPGVDPERIALWGTSFAGGHVVVTAARDHRIAAVVAQAPLADGLAAVLAVPFATSARLALAGVRDAVRGLRRKPPLLLPAVGEPGETAALTAPGAVMGVVRMNEETTPSGGVTRWQNSFSARTLLPLPFYRPVLAARFVTAPLLVCVCERDRTTPPAAARRLGHGTRRGEVRSYPIDHFEIYVGEPFERAVADQVEFLTRQLRPRVPPPSRTGAPVPPDR